MMRFIIFIATILCLTTGLRAAECKAVAGHIGEKRVVAVRHLRLIGRNLTLSGTFNGVNSPVRTLPCKPLKAGVFCEKSFGPVFVTVMTNGRRMVETLTDASGVERAGLAYMCDQAIKM